MRIVLTHTGSAVPDYTDITIRQMQYSNPGVIIDLIAEEQHGVDFINRYNLNINLITTESLSNDLLLQSFHKHSWFKAWGKPNTTYPSPENFVQGTSERLFLLNAHINKVGLTDVWHFENDNLVYGNVAAITDKLKGDRLRSNDRVIICDMGPQYVVFNCVYIPQPRWFNSIMAWYARQLQQGNEFLCNKFNLPMAHEMTIMKYHPDGFYFWPSLYTDVHNYRCLFDPAGYGQFIAGTNNGHAPGFTDKENHDIGKTHGIDWTDVEFDSVPRVVSKNNFHTPLFNLHMHNKTRIKDFANV